MAAERPDSDLRVLLLAPTPRDGEATRGVLAASGIACVVCPSLDHLCGEAVAGAAAVVVPEEVVLSDEAERLAGHLRRQPVWSDLPVIVLSRTGAESPAVERAVETLGNVSVVERPMRVSTLLSVVRAALRARERQYEVRDHLDARRMVEFRFQRLVEHSPQSTQLFHPDGRPRQVNRAFERLFGIKLDELRDYNILRDPELRRLGVTALVERAFAGDAVTIEPIPYVPDRGEYAGQTRWAGAYAYPVKDEAGRVEEVVLVHDDVTERKRAEEALRESEERYRRLVETAHEGVWAIDAAGRTTYVNRRMGELLGYTPDEMMGRVHTDFMWEQDRPKGDVEMERRREGTAAVWDQRYRRKDGGELWTVASCRALYDAGGEFVGALGMFTDITDRRRAEEALRESERRFRDMADTAPAMLWVTEVDGQCSFLSRGWYEFTGQTEQTGLGYGWTDAAHPDDRQAAREAFVAANEARREYAVDFRVRRADGEYRWVIDAGRPRFGPDGQFLGFIGSVIDITDRKRAEGAQRDSESSLLLAVSIAQLGTFEIDLRTDAVEVNDTGRAIYGWTPGEPLTFGKVQAHFHPDEKAEVMRRVADAFRPDGPGEFEVEQRIVRTDGHTRWIRVRGRASFEDFGGGGGGERRAVRCVGTYLDVTGQKESEHQREQLLASEQAAHAEAERAGRMKDEFLATLSHELRTPLNAILGWSQILAAGSRDDADLTEGLRTIERNARAQTQIIEDLLDMSRIISGKIRLDVQRLDLSGIVQAAVDTMRPAADAKAIRLQAVVDPKAATVSGDPGRLHQVFWNLISNAIKFTPKGGRVQVLLERVNSHLEVSVIDTGEGIRTEFLPSVFDRFKQADASTTRRHGGLGLGLSIVKQLVELHGGTVRALSPGEGLGSTFVVTLPLTPVHVEPDTQRGRRHPRAEAAPPAVLPDDCPKLKGVRVLVVDDEADSRDLVKRLLEDCEASVVMASSAAEAVDVVSRLRPDVLVSDIGMPGEDGYSLIRRVRALGPERGGNVPALALTAYARAEDRVRAVRAGFQTHVVKPVEPTELITMVASLAGRTE